MNRITIPFLAAFASVSMASFAAEKEKFFAYRSFWPEAEAMESFGKAGINLYAVMPSNSFNTLGESYCRFPPFWVWDDTYLWDIVDRQFDVALKANPNARFICMIDINSPLWLWRRVDRKYGIGGDSYQDISNSLCLEEWRKPTEKMVVEYIRHMEGRYGDRVVSYIIAGGGTSEWYCQSKGRAVPQKEATWSKWLKEHGKPDWNIPTQKELSNPAFEDRYYDPATQRHIIDYVRFTEELVAKGMDDFAQLARDAVDGKKQIGSFCGYIPMQLCGKLDNSHTFSSKFIDFIGSPGGYDNRDIGKGGGMKSPLASLNLTDKHWFQEIDQRTHTYNGQLTPHVKIEGIHASGAKNQKETNAILKREFSLSAVMHNSLWCFDMWGGNFSTPETMKLVKRAHEIWLEHKDEPSPYRAEMAVIVDPESGSYSKYSAFSHVKKVFYSLGAPFDGVLFRDIPKIDFSKYRLVVFPHTFEITPEKEAILRNHVLKDGRAVITMEGFGAADGKRIDASRVKKFTGFDYRTEGVNSRQMDGWESVYCGTIGALRLEKVREYAEKAGVHMYTKDPVPVYANGKLVAVHVKEGGKKEILLPQKAKTIVELFTGKTVAENTDKFIYDFESPDTALFELQNSPDKRAATPRLPSSFTPPNS